jgi:hypothetical protein
LAIDRNGSSVATASVASGTPPSHAIFVGALTNDGAPVAYGDGRFTVWYAGGALTGTNIADINTALNTYATAAGET